MATSNTSDSQAQKTLSIIERHQHAMDTKDIQVIAADYADDAIIMGTVFSKTLVGKAELEAAVAELLGDFTPDVNVHFLKKEAIGEHGYLVFESDTFFGTETYTVKNDKIVFESCTIYPK